MKIANDQQFRIYFYNYLVAIDFDVSDLVDYYEKLFKDYLMYHGYRSFIRDENNITKSYIYRDFDSLLLFYYKYGEI